MDGQSFDRFLRSGENPAREITTYETDGDADKRVEQQVNVGVLLNEKESSGPRQSSENGSPSTGSGREDPQAEKPAHGTAEQSKDHHELVP